MDKIWQAIRPYKFMWRYVIEQRRYLAKASKVPQPELQHLVYSALAISSVTQSKAAELLGVSIIDVREGLSEWLERQPQYIRDAADLVLSS